ncbi:hypothetical protein [Halobacterium litoreum]|uniref:Uncharacterized protein n=1 Tax=Halobacterium litoreum TaxID=2039234 RepID=A0ABD5N9W7_9EURY|nr:hypothetical protein [Halobacterium litoreum]UHH14825.1 hypothetical protein LT972_07420 [Halobacterium litoreum]
MPDTLTIVLGIGLVAVVVYALGFGRTARGAKTGASKAKGLATSTGTMLAGGAMSGLVAGDALAQYLASDPAVAIAGVTGLLGTLGLAGRVSLTPLQYALIVLVMLIGYAALTNGGD